jgi:hypothetical protein
MKIDVISPYFTYLFIDQKITILNRVKIIFLYMVLIYRRSYRFLYRALQHSLTILPIIILEIALSCIVLVLGKNLSWFSTVNEMIKYLLPFFLSTVVISFFISFLSDQSGRNKDLNIQHQLYWRLYYSADDFVRTINTIFNTDINPNENIQDIKKSLSSTVIEMEFWTHNINFDRFQSCTNNIELLNTNINKLTACVYDILDKSLSFTNQNIQIWMFKNFSLLNIDYYSTGDFNWSHFGDYHNKNFMFDLLFDGLYSTVLNVLKELHKPWDLDLKIDDKIINLSCPIK